MRLFFPNQTRPKKAARQLSLHFNEQLSTCQKAVAQACGYRDWHEMERSHSAEAPSPLDQALSVVGFRSRTADICKTLSTVLGVADGDIQAALPTVRLTGDRPYTLEDHHAIRILCWRSGPMPWLGKGKPGEVFLIDDKASSLMERGDPPSRAFRKQSNGSGVFFCSDTTTGGICATDETASPIIRLDDFIPLRLWLPYGWWTLMDGSEVLFSRDYKPLWKFDPNGGVERINPSTWITEIANQHYYQEEKGGGWYTELASQAAKERLRRHKISALPRLVDALPLLVANGKLEVGDAAQILDGNNPRNPGKSGNPEIRGHHTN
ncbi:MAG: hypothetical protein HQL89_18780 [Magnetococcales bacterium]|nr:hypothetical protein [Magnetococcales bacterium]